MVHNAREIAAAVNGTRNGALGKTTGYAQSSQPGWMGKPPRCLWWLAGQRLSLASRRDGICLDLRPFTTLACLYVYKTQRTKSV